jgi:hypothetical protein
VNDEELESLRQQLEAALSSDGWSVELVTGYRPHLQFKHPLTQTHPWGYGLNPADSPDDALQKVWRAIGKQHQFSDVRGGPIKTKRGRLLSGLRVAAGSYGWDREVYREVVWTLRELRVVGLAEAEWLERVGPVPRPPDMAQSKIP